VTFAACFLLTAVAQAPVVTSGALVTGHVLQADSRVPLADATVTLLPPPDRFQLDPSAFRPLSVTTDENGRFVLEGVQPLRYMIRARKAGFADGSGRAARPLTIAAGGRVDDIELLLEPAGVILGRVVDARGVPIERAMVMALRRAVAAESLAKPGEGDTGAPTARMLAAVRAGEETNAGGEFQLDEIPAGAYYLRAMPPIAPRDGGQVAGASRTFVRTYFPSTQNEADAVAVSVAAGLPLDVGDLVMMAADSFRITGRVVDESGRGVPDVMVRLVPATAPTAALPMTMDRAETDAEGAFALNGVVAGHYAVVAVPALVLRRDARNSAVPDAGSVSFQLGGTRSARAGGSVWTESRNGITRQYRDEFGSRQRVVVDADVPNLHIVVRPVPIP
jgi:protocatechuate 3,4-dioxygenase beta subunit